MSIGIKLPNGRHSRVIPRNTPLPVDRNFTISTSADEQLSLSVPFYQGESDLPEGNEYLGALKIVDLPPRPKGQTRCKIDLTVTNESLIRIKVSDMLTGAPLSARFDSWAGLRQTLSVEVFGDEPVLSGMVQTGVVNVPPSLKEQGNPFRRFWTWMTGRRRPEDTDTEQA